MRLLNWALDVDHVDPSTVSGKLRLAASGCVVIVAGVFIAVRGYYEAGRRWPVERGER